MRKNRMICLAAALCCLLSVTVHASAPQVACDSVYCFSGEDFSGEEPLAGICITGLPNPESGTVFLGERVLRPGDVLAADQLAQMTFAPVRGEEDRSAMLTYLPIYDDRVAASTTMTIAVLGKQDKAPVAEDSATETYKNLPCEAPLKVTDPEGQNLTFTLTRQPKRGEVVLRQDGSFLYTPKKNKVGVDSFTYTATDPAGNVSREATVTITILKPTDAKQYADTSGNSCRFAAEWMKNTGIFVGEQVAGQSCFQPEKAVTRGEFVTMLVKALEIPVEEEAAIAGYTDQLPDWLKPYAAAALRSGLTAGLPNADTFDADTPITGAEAAVMLHNALDLTVSSDVAVGEDVPAWAASAVTVMADCGITLDPQAPLTRAQAAMALYTAHTLAASAPGTRLFR